MTTRGTTGLRVRSAGATDRGQIRRNNEDAYFHDDEARLYGVADGLGGLPGGAVASRVAIREFSERGRQALAAEGLQMTPLIQRINERVRQEGVRIDPYGIGTTLTVIHLAGTTLRYGHVGDSSLVVVRNGKIENLTREHTMLEALLEEQADLEHDEIPEHFAHTLTRCVGQFGDLEVDEGETRVGPGDRILLSTDGIAKVIAPEEMEAILARARDAEKAVADLIALADERGGRDNATAVVIEID